MELTRNKKPIIRTLLILAAVMATGGLGYQSLNDKPAALTSYVDSQPKYVSHSVNQLESSNADIVMWYGDAWGNIDWGLSGDGVMIGLADIGMPTAHRAVLQKIENWGSINPLWHSVKNNHATAVAGVIACSGFPDLGGQMEADSRGFAYKANIHWEPAYGKSDLGSLVADMAAYTDVAVYPFGEEVGWSKDLTSIDNPDDPDGPNILVKKWMSFSDVSLNETSEAGKYTYKANLVDSALHSFPGHLAVWSAGNENGNGLPTPTLATPQNPPASWSNAYYVVGVANPQATIPWATGITAAPTNEANLPPNPGRFFAGSTLSWDHLHQFATAKNNLVVGAIDENDSLWTQSSCGPTDDGRMKPDMVAVGVDVTVPWRLPDGEPLPSPTQSNPNPQRDKYVLDSGTSLSAAAVTGGAALLMEARDYYGRPDMLAATRKALLLHTARDLGPAGPDYRFGYGAMDVEDATTLIAKDALASGYINTRPHIKEYTIKNDYLSTFKVRIPVDGIVGQPAASGLKVTLCWNDPARAVVPGYESTVMHLNFNYPTPKQLVNDLDLVVEKSTGGNQFLPYVLNPDAPHLAATHGVNNRDNVEQVFIGSVNQGDEYIIKIQRSAEMIAQGKNFVGGEQKVSVIISGNESDFDIQTPEGPFFATPETIGGTTSISYPSIAAVPYRIDWSMDMSNWAVLESGLLANGDLSTFDLDATTAGGFFRVMPLNDANETGHIAISTNAVITIMEFHDIGPAMNQYAISWPGTIGASYKIERYTDQTGWQEYNGDWTNDTGSSDIIYIIHEGPSEDPNANEQFRISEIVGR